MGKQEEIELKIVQWDIEKLIGAEYNPRQLKDHQFNSIKDSIQRFGFTVPILVNVNKDRYGIIIGGHQRINVANHLGIKKIPVVEKDLTLEQERELNIRLNKNTGEWDWDSLANFFDAEELLDWGFQDEEINFGIDDMEFKEEGEEDNFEGEIPETPNTQPGDIYQMNGHRLHCASSTDAEAVAKLTEGKEFDCVVTDPPYNVAYEGKTKEKLTIQNDAMDDGNFYQFLLDFYTAFGSHTRKGGAWYVWHADSEGANFRKAMVEAGILLKQTLIWVKDTLVMGRQDYHWKHEPCLYGWREGAAHFWNTDRKQTTVLEFDRPKRNDVHPTMKPIPLIVYQIQNSSKKGDIIGDAFLGSGTTLIASEQTERICYGQELDPKYCDVIVKRWVSFMKENSKEYTITKNGVDIKSEDWINS